MLNSAGGDTGAWAFVVPFNDSRFAKSRLTFSQPLRRNLALSMLHDTVRGLLAVQDVERVFVVCGRDEDAFELHAWPRVETIIEDSPGLNEAIRLGEITAFGEARRRLRHTDLDGLQQQEPRSRTAQLLALAQHGVG